MLRARIGSQEAIGFVFENPNSADVIVGMVPPGKHDLVLYDGVQEVARARDAVEIRATSGPSVRLYGWITALNEAKAFLERNPSEARAILAKYTKLPPEVAEKIPFPNYEFSIQPAQLDVWVRTLHDLGQLSVAVDSNKLVVTPK